MGLAGLSFEDAPNFLKILAHSPAALKAYVEAEAALQGLLTPKFRVQIALGMAKINDSRYCLMAHHELIKGTANPILLRKPEPTYPCDAKRPSWSGSAARGILV